MCGANILIFLAVGTWIRGFDRLVQTVDEFVKEGIINDDVVAQVGNGSYKPDNMKVIAFCSPDEFVRYITYADIIISHAGIGTIAQVVKQSKPIIVVPRKAELGEVDDDHQFETAKQLESEGKILVAYEVDDLPEKIEQAKDFVPVQGKGGQGIINAVQEFIDMLAENK